jgi:hypothetical protein
MDKDKFGYKDARGITIIKRGNKSRVQKHGSHNQKTHGNKGGGGESSLSQGAIIDIMNQQRTPEFLGKISPDEMKAMEDYMSGSGAYGVVNIALREGEAELYPSQKATADRIIPNIDSVITDAPPLKEELTTYRGLFGSEQTATFTSMKAGDTYTDMGFASTSMNRRVAETFARSDKANAGVVLEIVNPKGSKGIFPLAARTEITSRFVSDISEDEWLIPRGTTFKVLSVAGKDIKVEVVG